MSTSRLVLGFGLVLTLTIALMLVLSNGSEPAELSVSTTSQAAPSTVPITTATTTPEPASPTTTTLEQREEEVAAILHRNFVVWFQAIYENDPDRLWDAVATKSLHDAGIEAMATITFRDPPNADGLSLEVLEVLLDRQDCLVVHYRADAQPFLGAGASLQGVEVLWPNSQGVWRNAAAWNSPADVWLPDCDVRERDIVP